MKKLFLSLLLFVSYNSFSQSAKIIEDTVFYLEHKFVVGDSVQLWYGSKQDKTFAFVSIGSGLAGGSKATANWSKTYMKIDKVYKVSGKCYLRGKILGSGMMLGNKFFVDIEGAVDNKELKFE